MLALPSQVLLNLDHVPIWGSLADRYGPKPWCLELPLPWHDHRRHCLCPFRLWLLVTTLAQWGLSGFVPNSTALIVIKFPGQSGCNFQRTLSTELSWLEHDGALIGGLIAENLGMHMCILLVGLLIFGFPLNLLGHWEDYEPLQRTKIQLGVAQSIQQKDILLGSFDQHDHSKWSLQSISPSASLCAGFGTRDNLIFIEDDCFSCKESQYAFSGWMGKLGDESESPAY